ncbi:hypothetical protein TSOC_013894, partial [Tetrabaena socialis]
SSRAAGTRLAESSSRQRMWTITGWTSPKPCASACSPSSLPRGGGPSHSSMTPQRTTLSTGCKCARRPGHWSRDSHGPGCNLRRCACKTTRRGSGTRGRRCAGVWRMGWRWTPRCSPWRTRRRGTGLAAQRSRRAGMPARTRRRSTRQSGRPRKARTAARRQQPTGQSRAGTAACGR